MPMFEVPAVGLPFLDPDPVGAISYPCLQLFLCGIVRHCRSSCTAGPRRGHLSSGTHGISYLPRLLPLAFAGVLRPVFGTEVGFVGIARLFNPINQALRLGPMLLVAALGLAVSKPKKVRFASDKFFLLPRLKHGPT